MKKHIPNSITLLNLVSGSIGIVIALQGNLIGGTICIGIGAILDFLDGFLAKILSAHSPIGKQLDSLADLITFGLLPAVIMYALIKEYNTCPYRPFFGLLMVCASAFRLAKFNVDEGQQNVFIGLPTPANALFIATLPIIIAHTGTGYLVSIITYPLTTPLITVLFSWLLIAPIKFIALKFKDYSYQNNKLRYAIMGISILLIVSLQVVGVALSLLCHMILSILFQKKIDH